MIATLPANVAAYYHSLVTETGCLGYRFTPTPLKVRRELYDRLNAAVPALIGELKQPAYFERCIERDDWRLPVRLMKPADYTGCADFLLTGDGAKLIEMNMHLPGKTGLMQTLGKTARTFLGDPRAEWTNFDFNSRLVEAIEAAIPGEGPIAIVVSHLIAGAMHLAHHDYLSRELNAAGLETAVVPADRIVAGPEGLLCDGVLYTRAISCVLPFVWEHNPAEFTELTRFWKLHPDRLFPNPTGGMFGTKDLLCWLHERREEEGAGSWSDLVLRASPLSDFPDKNSLMNAFQPGKSVLKPLKDYDTRGVFVQPDSDAIGEAFSTTERRYMVQEFTDSLNLPFLLPDGGEAVSHSVIFRVFFAAGKPIGQHGFFVHRAFNGEYYTAPVIVEG